MPYNVRGPDGPVSFLGQEVEDLSFRLLAPPGLYVGIISYNGQVSATVTMDPKCADPAALAAHWGPQFARLFDEVCSGKTDSVRGPPKLKVTISRRAAAGR